MAIRPILSALIVASLLIATTYAAVGKAPGWWPQYELSLTEVAFSKKLSLKEVSDERALLESTFAFFSDLDALDAWFICFFIVFAQTVYYWDVFFFYTS